MTLNYGVARRFTNEVDSIIGSRWTNFFKCDEELILVLRNLNIDKLHILKDYNLFKGYVYIISFSKRLQDGGSLSDKQLIQCKRLAREIKKASLLMMAVN